MPKRLKVRANLRDIVHSAIVLSLFGVIASQSIHYGELKDTLYQRCTASKPGNDAANEFRRAEVDAFEAFTKDPTTTPDRRARYEVLVAGAQKAVKKYRPVDCRIYR